MISEIAALAAYHKYENEPFQPNCIFESTPAAPCSDNEAKKSSTQSPPSHLFYGYGIASLLLRKYARSNGNTALLIISIVFALFRGLLTILYRMLNRSDMDFSEVELVQVILASLIVCYGYFSSFVFMIYFIRDLKMKHFLQHQCKLILQFRKNDFDDMKFLPTIDFTDPYSLKGTDRHIDHLLLC